MNLSPGSDEPVNTAEASERAEAAYPQGVVRALMASDLMTPPTRQALEARLQASREAEAAAPAPLYFDIATFAVLEAVCGRLLALEAGDIPTAREVAADIDKRLAEGKGNGWRYDHLPRDGETYVLALAGLDEAARAVDGGANFAILDSEDQERILRAVCAGAEGLPGDTWKILDAYRFFEDLLAEVVEVFYSHPLAQEEIGYVGMADARGWKRFGLNVLETWEPKPNTPYALPPSSDFTPPPPVRESAEIILLPEFADSVASAAETAPAAAPLRPRSAPLPNPAPVDVVVIGTGAGGAPILARLAQAGFSVVALEAGKFWEPVRDFVTDERSQAEKIFWMDERLSAGKDPIGFGNNNSGTGVGGSTLHFTAYTPRPHPDDFRLRTDFGVGADWPLRYEDLEPYLTEAEQFLGVSGPTIYPWGGARSGGYPLPPLPLNGAAQLMERGCREIGLRTSPAPNAALSAPYSVEGVGMRKACTNRGFCQAGCSVGAKSSMDVTFIPLAIAHGAEVRSECFVTRIDMDRSRDRVTGVVYRQGGQGGQELRQACQAVFICAGAIESPRLLLLNGLGSYHGQVGRHFMAHPGLQLWAQFDEDIRPYKGIPGGLISEDTHRPKDADFAGGYLLQSLGVMPVTYISQYARGERVWGAPLREHMMGYNHVAGINILGEGLPYDSNYLELSDEKDDRGLPKPRIHYTAGENEKRMTAHADRTMRAIWEAAGAKRHSWSFQRFAHTIGTCRMGTDAATSVVNPDCRVHDFENLYICDNSVFPSALAVNPALTQIALSLRTADRFIDASRRGEM